MSSKKSSCRFLKKKILILVRSETEILTCWDRRRRRRTARVWCHSERSALPLRHSRPRKRSSSAHDGRAGGTRACRSWKCFIQRLYIDFSKIAYLLRKSRVNRWLAIEPAQNSRLKSKITQVSQSREKGDAAQTLSNDFHGSRKLIKSLENSWLIDFYENKKR